MDEEQTIPELEIESNQEVRNEEIPVNSHSFTVVEGSSATEYASLGVGESNSVSNGILERSRRNRRNRRTDYVVRSIANQHTNLYIRSNMTPIIRISSIIGNIQSTNNIEYESNFIPFKTHFDPDVDEFLFDIDNEKLENLTSDNICSICLTGSTYIDISNNNENNLTNNKFCHLSCADTHKFHHQCIKSWLKKNLTCPCCRAIPEKII